MGSEQATVGSEDFAEFCIHRKIQLTDLRPKIPVPTSNGGQDQYSAYQGMTSLKERRSLARPSEAATSKPHQALSVDRIRGQSRLGRVKLLEFNEAKNWAEVEQTHLRLFEFRRVEILPA